MPDGRLRAVYLGSIRRFCLELLILVTILPSLSGCLLISGAVQTSDSTSDGGNVYVDFVSADGTDTRAVQTNFPAQALEVLVAARTEHGQLRIEILDEQNSVVLALDAQSMEEWRQGIVTTDVEGIFRYRIRATGAQRGTFQILYQPADG